MYHMYYMCYIVNSICIRMYCTIHSVCVYVFHTIAMYRQNTIFTLFVIFLKFFNKVRVTFFGLLMLLWVSLYRVCFDLNLYILLRPAFAAILGLAVFYL